MKVGDKTGHARSFSKQDLLDYVELSDHETTGNFVPEPLIGALFSFLLGVKLPGLGTHYLKQDTHYQSNALIGESLSALVEITRLRPDKQLVDLATSCYGADGRTVANGRALVYVGDVPGNSSEN